MVVNQKAAIHQASAGVSQTQSSFWLSVCPYALRTGLPRRAPSQLPYWSTPRCTTGQLKAVVQERVESDHFCLAMLSMRIRVSSVCLDSVSDLSFEESMRYLAGKCEREQRDASTTGCAAADWRPSPPIG